MEENKDQKKESQVEIIDFGPLRIKGNFIIKDMKRDKEESPEEIFLCRCGKSLNKPYCDESHKK
jgi:CDGSH iron-sulfur domain-containing protein 3